MSPPKGWGGPWVTAVTRCWTEGINAEYTTKADKLAQILGLKPPDIPGGTNKFLPQQNPIFLRGGKLHPLPRRKGKGSKSVIWGSKALGKEAKAGGKAL